MDGRRAALVLESLGHIRIVSLRGEPEREIQVAYAPRLISPSWAADGRALFVCGSIAGEYELLRVYLDGRSSPVVANLPPDVRSALPSPDGRSLAIMAMT